MKTINTLVEDEVRNELIYPALREKRDKKNLTYVEVGVFVGGNILRVHDFCYVEGINAHIFGVDNFSFHNISDESLRWASMSREMDFKKSVEENLTNTSIKLVDGDSLSGSVLNLFQDNSIDVLFLDGDHSYEVVSKELDLWTKKVAKGGYIVGHDWPCDGVKHAVMERYSPYEILISSTLGGYRVKVK